ncbi:hypothetical protein ACVWWR_003824 [Bradyrhizobium sp. LM3.2]
MTRNFGTTNSDTPVDAGGRALDAGEHEVDDVGGEVMLAGRNEDLGACDLEAAIGLAHRLGAEHAEVGAAMRLGQVHGAGPLARHHLRHVGLLLLGRAVDDQRRCRAHGEAAIHREGHVGGDLEFVDRLAQRHRQTLAAELGRGRQAEPAALGDLLERVLEALRRGDAAVIGALAAFEIAHTIERLEHLFGELCGFAQNGFAHVARRVGEAGQIVIAVDLEDVVEQEVHVFDGGFVDRHGVLPA